MDDPQIDVCGNYILIYDVQGTQAAILTNTGFKQTIKTAMPIVDANIASQGTVAILMQDGEAGYVQVCNDAGKVLASGELHMKNSGYPLAIALSSHCAKAHGLTTGCQRWKCKDDDLFL